jgi:hypothetical protein
MVSSSTGLVNPGNTLGKSPANRQSVTYREPSENYGNAKHTTVAAFLPWRGL